MGQEKSVVFMSIESILYRLDPLSFLHILTQHDIIWLLSIIKKAANK